MNKYEILESAIPIGKENAIHQDDLDKILKSTSGTAKKMVRVLRLKGVPILSGIQGYWRTDNKIEAERFLKSFLEEANSRLEIEKQIKSTFDNKGGCMSHSEAFSKVSEEVTNNEQE